MLIDLKKIDRSINLKSDICIVGAGAAGITMALEFLDTGHNVLLMESGGFNFNAKTQSLYDGKIIGMPYGQFTLESSRLRYYGGSTNHWGGWVAPLDKIDFEKRESIPMTGWPVTLDEMQPYYSRAQQYLANHSFDFDNLSVRVLAKTLNSSFAFLMAASSSILSDGSTSFIVFNVLSYQ